MKAKARKNGVEVHLKPSERAQLRQLLKGGHEEVRHIRRAQILLQLDQGRSAAKIAEIIGVTDKTARTVGRRYQEGGLQHALEDNPRPGGEPLLTENQAQQIIAMVCGSPPEGLSRWSIRVTAEEVMKRKIVPHIGRETVRVLLLSHDLKPWRKKNVVHPRSQFRISRKDGGRTGSVQKASES
jgi:transposase